MIEVKVNLFQFSEYFQNALFRMTVLLTHILTDKF